MQAFLSILFRWVHVITACVVIGSAFFMRVLLPIGIKVLDPEPREAVFLRCRRAFKMVVHSGILLLLISGIYNAVLNWPAYHQGIPRTHAFFGLHVLLALTAFAISLTILAGREPPRSHASWMRVNLVILFLAVAAASCLKWAREHAGAPASHASLRSASRG